MCTEIVRVDLIELNDQKCRMDFVMLDKATCEVHEIPGDGNYLFGAITHQLCRYDMHSITYKEKNSRRV